MADTALFAYILAHLPLLRRRDFLVEILTETDRVPLLPGGLVHTKSPLYIGKLLQAPDETLVAVTAVVAQDSGYRVDTDPTGIVLPKHGALITYDTEVVLPPGTLANQPKGAAQTTTFGRMLLNYLIFAEPFGDVFPYHDGLWSGSFVEKLVATAVVENRVTPAQMQVFGRNLYFIGHMTETAVPIYTEKSLTTSPEVKNRRAELKSQYGEAIVAGDSVAMTTVEQELIALDKAYLKDDPSMGYYTALGGKAFNVQRKKMFLTGGMVEQFGNKGHFDFVPQSLEDGWTEESLPIIANEIRAGSFSRAKETAKGGEEGKFLMRMFQNIRITEDDCGTRHTIPLLLKPATAYLYRYRTILLPGGRKVILDDTTLPQYIGKQVNLRSPMACASKSGYCYTCMGELFRSLNQRVLSMRANAISAWMVTSSLKLMHGKSFQATKITSLNPYTY